MSEKEIVVSPYKKRKIMAKNHSPKEKHIIRAKISNHIPDLTDHPFFVEKREVVTAFLRNHPLPDHLLSAK